LISQRVQLIGQLIQLTVRTTLLARMNETNNRQ
jgi:hypothetical protein